MKHFSWVGPSLDALRQVRLDPAYLLGALRPFPLPSSDRAAAQQILAEALKVRGHHAAATYSSMGSVLDKQRGRQLKTG